MESDAGEVRLTVNNVRKSASGTRVRVTPTVTSPYDPNLLSRRYRVATRNRSTFNFRTFESIQRRVVIVIVTDEQSLQ